MIRQALVMAAIALAAGCSKAEPPPSAIGAATPAPAAAPAPTDDSARIVGRVHASGVAVVALEPKTPRTFPQQAETPVMDQVGQTFGPELLLVRTGEAVEFRNSDDTLHNINVKDEQTREQAFNVAIPTGGAYTFTFKKDGFYRVGCDIHPAMAASIFAASTPYTAIAETDGRFEFTGVPPGPWTVIVYTGGRRLQKEVDVKDGVTDVTIGGETGDASK
ncbi:MAG TPA: plastocyanin/azurin family copper-binding protein [Vicinamibacterales bacterium]|nr:plastocyanin/azurin family copper-binding protein [Vicinamibacterales bacterium]